jgi:hypothetical protein
MEALMRRSIFMGLACLLVSGSLMLAQNRPRLRFDPASETTLSGMVSGVAEVKHGRAAGIHFTLTTDSETVEVRAGPKRFLERNNFTIADDNQVTVNGWTSSVDGKTTIIAREIRNGDKTITLRNEKGVPAWSQGRRGGTKTGN